MASLVSAAPAQAAPLRLRVTRFRFALGWTFLALGVAIAFGLVVASLAVSDPDLVQALQTASLIVPWPLAAAALYLLATSRSAEFDPATRELRAAGQALPFDRLCALWLLSSGNPVGGKGSRFAYTHYRLTLITDQVGQPFQEAVEAAVLACADQEGVGLAPFLKKPGVLDALKAPASGALIPLVEAGPEAEVRGTARRISALTGLPLVDMTDPRAPQLRARGSA